MNFRKKSKQDDLEINFIPLIDVLLVIIIFLVVSTTFSKFSELKINLPTAEANQVDKKVEKINISSMINTHLQESIQIRFIQIDCGTIITQKKVKKYNTDASDKPN